MKLSLAEYRELKFRMKQKSDMELYEEAQKLKPEEHAIEIDGSAEPEPIPCPLGDRRVCGKFCPLWFESEAMCSIKVIAIALSQISNILSQRR